VPTQEESTEQVIRLISHDLCSPLTAVQLNAQLIEQAAARGGHDSEQRWAMRIIRAARRMREMLQRLVEAERIRSGRIPLVLEPVLLDQLVHELLGKEDEELAPARVRVRVPQGPVELHVDAKRVAQALGALLRLALQECNRDVDLEVRVAAGQMLCEIRGSAPAEATTEADGGGHGPSTAAGNQGGQAIALHLARTLIECHGGRVEVQQRGDVAVGFDVLLPLERRTG
jgi:two-component system sensor histidine kinase KdpD